MRPFKIHSPFKPCGDQPQAIQSLVENFKKNKKKQVLLGVTGSGKTFTMAGVIEQLKRPTLILVHNKTLAGQLYAEFKSLFPENAVEYFVSYYDYYQPEAYIPSTHTFIEKDSSINDQIDRMRHAATRALIEREDVIIVASVSCIYGLGSPDIYKKLVLNVKADTQMNRNHFLRDLVKLQYSRNDIDFKRGTFRVRGDSVEVFPPSEEERIVRVEFFGDFIEQISWLDSLKKITLKKVDEISFFPTNHYIGTEEINKRAIESIRKELREMIQKYKRSVDMLKAERIEQRTSYDLELMGELGFCPGIENYSRHFSGRQEGAPPPTLLEYFPEDFLLIIDESHVSVPQVGGMYRGDRARKLTLVEHAFRLPSALDNRPLNFQEFEDFLDKTLYVSATPGEYELRKSSGLIAEQINRPTGLLDPQVEVRKAKYQVDDLLDEIKKCVSKKQRTLVTTLTKKMAEDLTHYYSSIGIKVKYLHSDVKTIERMEIVRDLRLGVFDVLIGINLLREGLDLPEVSLVAILDADKEGFLRSQTSLIQTIGRAARHIEGKALLYADRQTNSIKKAIEETRRRRKIQEEHNKKHHIKPQSIKSEIRQGLMEIFTNTEKEKEFLEKEAQKYKKDSKALKEDIAKLHVQMKKAAAELNFEEASRLRDEIKRCKFLELELLDH